MTSQTSPVPIGNVTFSVDGQQVGSPVKLVSGAASITTTSLTSGSHAILAAYSGDKVHRATKASETVTAQ